MSAKVVVSEQATMALNMQSYCKQLSLPAVCECYESEAVAAAQTRISYQEYLYKLLQIQVLARCERAVASRIKMAGFPFIKTLEEFDFSFQPKLDEKLLRELACLRFLDTAHNILLIGPPGTGKTHLAVALGLKAAFARKSVRFFSAESLVTELVGADVSGRLQRCLLSLAKLDLVIIDELGYLQLDQRSASLFFRLIAKRYEKTSVIITSNKPFEEWGQIFKDDTAAAAILDRLLHHCHPFFIQGRSYRMKELFGHPLPPQPQQES